MKRILISLSILLAIYSCKEDVSKKKGTIVFTNAITENSYKSAEIENIDEIAFAIVTIESSNGEIVYDKEKIEVFKIENQILSLPLELLQGDYNLTDFYLVDANNNILFIAPKTGSDKAPYVKTLLPIEFNIFDNDETKTNVEVISSLNASPEAFGYAEFDVQFVKTFDILVSLFKYDDLSAKFILTEGIIEATGVDFNLTDSLKSTNNVITLLDNLNSYQIKISKDGVIVYDYTFTIDSIKQHKVETMRPIKVIIDSAGIIILQPGSDVGKDARIASYTTDQGAAAINTNYALAQEITGVGWTFGGNAGAARGLIDFDLPQILYGQTISEAKLYLTAVANLSYCINSPSHSQLSGSNACYLSQITAPWEEHTVTWNNQPTVDIVDRILMPASENDMQNYVVDVTDFINKELANPEDYHGFMMQLESENPYRRLHFGSSDAPDSETHPKLVIKY